MTRLGTVIASEPSPNRRTAARPQGRLMSSLSLQAATALQTTMSPRLQRAVRLLQMSSQDFAQVVRDAVDTNPFLEQEDAGPSAAEAAPPQPVDASDANYESWGVDGGSRLRYSDGDGSVFDT